MRRAELDWFRLGFPHDLAPAACLAALAAFSGAPHQARLVFDLEGTSAGIVHRLAISRPQAGLVTATLRATVPSLRLDQIKAPDRPYKRRLLLQLQPSAGVIRTDDLAPISAGLLSSLFPLEAGELLRLSWIVRPGVRPALPHVAEKGQDGRLSAIRAKLALPGLCAYGELAASARTPARLRELVQRLASPLWSLSTPHGRVVAEPYWWGQLARVFGQRGRYLSVHELAAVIGWPIDGPDLPGLSLGAAKRLVPSVSLPDGGRTLGVSDFTGLARPVAISPAASTRGLYVLGPTGTGKTSLLKNLIRDDLDQGRGLAVAETNGDLIRDLLDLIPPHRISDVVLIDPTDREHAVGFNPFVGSADASLVADQLGELFQRLWKDFWGPRTGQLAHMGLLTLARRRGSTLLDLPRLFLDERFRGQVLADLDDPIGLGPDWRWFSTLSDREQATVVAPLLNKVRQFTARASIRAIIGQADPAVSMRSIMAERKVLLVHLPKGLIGSETATLLGCLVLTALWQAAAERAALPSDQRHPFGLYVDEVQDFADAPIPWDEMFAQGRKYGLALTVAHQNLGQLPRELREVVLANARSKTVFALSAADAKKLKPLFAPALDRTDLQGLDAYSVAALVALDDGSTARPVTLRTPQPPETAGSATSVRAQSHRRYARKRADVETELRRQASAPSPPPGPVGRKPRATR